MRDSLFMEKTSDILTCLHLNLNYLENEFNILQNSKRFSDIRQDMDELSTMLREEQKQLTV